MWEWLGDALAIDFANTLKRRGRDYEELLASPNDVVTWARHERGRVPAVDADDVAARLGEVREARDDVFAVLGAVADGERPPPAAARRLDDRLRACPVVPLLGGGHHVGGDPGPLDELLARVAASTVELAATEADRLALCDAPSCGQFFLRERGNQRWCGPACGNRARVARHAHAAR